MALPDSTSLAPVVATRIKNVQFKAVAAAMPRKILLLGTYDPTLTGTVEDIPVQVSSPEDAGSKFGWGFPAHRMAISSFKKGGQLPTYISPQGEAAGAVAAQKTLTVTGSATAAGTVAFYIDGDRVAVPVASGDTPTAVAAAIVTKIAADRNLPVTSASTAGVVTTTAKAKGTWGNFTTIALNLKADDELPAGIAIAIADTVSGATDPTVDAALAALGTGDNQNADFFTDCVQAYGAVSAPLDAISTYNGTGNLAEGNFSPTVGRPFSFLNVSTVKDAAGLTAMKSVSSGRKLDRTNGYAGAPDSAFHPVEIACEINGVLATIAQANPAQGYEGRSLSIDTGDTGHRWTDSYSSRDDACKNGLGTTKIENGIVVIDKINSFYHPDNVPASSNGYRARRNMAIIQNLLFNMDLYFKQEQWRGIYIVADASKVAGSAKKKVRDLNSINGALDQLADAFEQEAWIFESAYTKENKTVTLRPGGNGFNYTFPVVLSAQGDVIDGNILFDIALTVFTG